MNNWTVRQRIAASFAAVILATLALGWIAYLQLRVIDQAATAIQTHSLPGQRLIAELTIALVDNHALAQEHIIRADPAAMTALDEQIRRNWTRLEELGRAHDATVGSAEDRALFEAFRSDLDEYRRLQAGILRASAEARRDEAHTGILTELDPVYERARAALNRLSLHDRAESDADIASILEAIDRTATSILIGFVVAVAIALLAGVMLLRAITQPLGRLVGIAEAMGSGDFTQRVPNDRGDEFGMLGRAFNRMTDDLTAIVGQVQQSTLQVNTSVTEIAATAKEQQATASEIAATTTEIGATSREITATSKELARTMDEVATVAEQTASLAGTGQTGLSRMEETMRQVMEAVSSINAKLAVLNEKAGNINQVVTTITKVADQTNLLSLNAAIEAEKAGEYGRGFSVVATEIRRLADQTAVATYDIEQMVKEIQSAVSAGVMGMDKFSEEVRRGVQDIHQVGSQLSQIIQQVQTLAPRVESVNEGMNAQSTGAEQISQALTQLSEAAQQTVESLRQSNTAIEGLNQVSAGLRASVAQLKLNA